MSVYKKRRDPSRTPEPMGDTSAQPSKDGHRFVVQEHHARALHWDFRLEHDGVLVSWALPKGVPDRPEKNHLAVKTEDHPLEYANFAGVIPKGEYGGGTVTIWDSGTYELQKWRDDEVMVVLDGTKARGRYVLFATGGKNWMIHRMDQADPRGVPMPERISPMLAVSGTLPSADRDFAYEMKWDGVRAITYVEKGHVRVLSRNDRDVTGTFPELRALGEALGARSAVLDGEIVALDEDGRPSFGRLQQRLGLKSERDVARRAAQFPVDYMVFDVMYLEGELLVDRTYDERRAVLESLELTGTGFQTTDSVTDRRGSDLLKVSKAVGFEGIMAKRRGSPYRVGRRSSDWLKIKNFLTQEVVIGGWTKGKGERTGSLGALLVGLPQKGGLSYLGKVGTGFDESMRTKLMELLAPLGTDKSPFIDPLPRADAARSNFVEPRLVGEVRYSEWTRDARLRHPSFRGLRPDKSPDEVVRES